MERDRDVWIGIELSPLATGKVRVETEATSVEAAEQHHARGREPVERARRDDHRFGLKLSVRDSVVIPTLELHERIGVEVALVERARE